MSSLQHHGNGDLPDTGGTCCYGAAVYGPHRCTCWVEVYDLEQTPPDEQTVTFLSAGIRPNTRRSMCPDCAYRPKSPERTGDEGYEGDAEDLEMFARSSRFYCHSGMRRPVRLRHPSGVEIDGHPAAYRPPIVDGVPYRADGTPGELCAGWDARRRAIAASEGRT